MPRPLRTYSISKIYHIILKGIDDQDIFYSNQDKNFFLKQLSITKKKFNYQIYSYCLMDNHVHMVIRIENELLSKAMQSISVRYAHYFNQKYKRVGPFLQNRFKSKKVEDLRYFLEVCRYVHRNPENVGMSKTEDYEWSSFKEYIGKEKIIDKKTLLHYFNNNIDEFIKYTIDDTLNNVNDFAEYEIIEKLTDEQLSNIIAKKIGIDETEDVAIFFKNRTKKEIKKDLLCLKNIQGTNLTQISRVIRIGRSRIEKIWNEET